MSLQEFVTLKRDCEAVEIPSGRKMTLPAGTEVVITQSLGGTYTVYTKEGVMASIVGKDADALGKEPPPPPGAEIPPEERSVEKLVWNQLRTCYDPEIPHNIVDLGLIYGCHVTPLPEGGHKVSITMTLTA
ncbi:MAG: DUF59 domain-containing protein, partial [Candidatus Omnitrophica bacterium]|nr:DUF59 domain-containing protein [Candidatus Omnitrophota bacterium]